MSDSCVTQLCKVSLQGWHCDCCCKHGTVAASTGRTCLDTSWLYLIFLLAAGAVLMHRLYEAVA